MSRVISNLTDAVKKLNTLYNTSSTPPNAGEEDYLIWTDLLNIAIDNWESEEGMLWRQLFTKLSNAADGTKTTTTATSYALPTLFRFPNSRFVWLGSGTQKTAVKVLKPEEISIRENDSDTWCYFTPTTLEFNPNMTITAGQTINYDYYKYASSVSSGADTFEMSDPMYAVYYALSELKKDEGDVSAYQMALQKLEAMKTLNFMVSDLAPNSTINPIGNGFGTIGNYPIAKT